ncbi:MAG: hypothetical protein WB493_13545 [Anaeromyxobacteraceae bacterium]
MTAAVTWIPALQPPGRLVAAVARQGMVLTLFLVGAGLSREAIRRAGVRPFVLGSVPWVVVGGVMLAAVRWGSGHG